MIQTQSQHKIRSTIIFLSLLLTFLWSIPSLCATNFNQQSYGIGEFSNREAIVHCLDKNEAFSGLSLHLYLSSEEQKLYLDLENGTMSFLHFLKRLKTYLASHKDTLFPLFIDYKGDPKYIKQELKALQLFDLIYSQSSGERWPSVASILAQKKQIILFIQPNNGGGFINKTMDHILDFAIDTDSNCPLYKGDISSELLMIRKFTKEHLKDKDVPTDWNRINYNSYSIDYLIGCWNTIGKQPNFIFYSDVAHTKTIHYLTKILREYDSLSGRIYTDTKILHGIHWAHNEKAFTGGYFCFPTDKVTIPKLVPLRNGYRFSPQSQAIAKNTKASNLEFTAQKHEITDGLKALYLLDGTLDNEVNKKHKHAEVDLFVEDLERGRVLKLKNKNAVSLSHVKDYGLNNNSFTISIYLKYNKVNGQNEYCILGNDEDEFRKGLHAMIKYEHLAFGFYTNDSSVKLKLQQEQWYQLTVRYDINKQTQSIFLDGQKISESQHHPSFIGSSALTLGHGINQDNYFSGYLDNLTIWERALSDQEIEWISHNAIKIEKNNKAFSSVHTIVSIILLALLILLTGLLFRQGKRRSKTKNSSVPSKIKQQICLYGDFAIYDALGINHSENFSPKTKELFILLLIHSINNPKGIASKELTHIIWKDFEPEKAANNRGVTFNHLKKILNKIEGIEAIYENKYWRLSIDAAFTCDYEQVKHLLDVNKKDYKTIYNLVKRGRLVQGASKDWMLELQTTHSLDLIDVFLSHIKHRFNKKDYTHTLEMVNYLSQLDDLNTEVLYYQVKCLLKVGNKSKATFVFDQFCERYKRIHSEAFSFNFKDFIAQTEDDLLI